MITGVALANFMSYENAYVPLEPGLNLICGPNGAGKSSILLGISVVLGQAYTERAKRLSDLIRWKADQARVTVFFENRRPDGKRLFPDIRSDVASITRVLKRSGTYHYLIQENVATKAEVEALLDKIGLNPDNMLIIMHQLMVGRFASISAAEKLQMLEEAVGFRNYRIEVLDAHSKLRNIKSEETALAQILESTKETHDYWRREYERYLHKKELERKLGDLNRELTWARIAKSIVSVNRLQERKDSRRRMVESTEAKIGEARETAKRRESKFEELKLKKAEIEEDRLGALREQTKQETNLGWSTKLLEELREITSKTQEAVPSFVEKWEESYKNILEAAELDLAKSKDRANVLKERLSDIASKLDEALGRLIQSKVDAEVLEFRLKLLAEELSDLEAQFRIAKDELDPQIGAAEKLGPRIDQLRSIMEIMVDTSSVEEQLKPIGHLSEDVEKMYEDYSKMFQDLRKKAELVAQNREEVLAELDKRLSRWREVLESFLEDLNVKYGLILSEVNATGSTRLTNTRDIEKAGLEILVGFKSADPTPLDSFSQSGGERSVAMMAFLLALQQNITSPFRAIDEFDVHMDPKNREIVSRLIVASAKTLGGGQYVAITPGQISAPDSGVHVIVVQNVQGSSQVAELTAK